MINIVSTDKVLVGDRFEATCKKQPLIYSANTFGYDRIEIILRESAVCQIRKECNRQKEAEYLRRLQRAFAIVETNNLQTVSINLGQLKCDNCIEPKIRKFHTGLHRQQPFKIDRIERFPAISFVDDEISRGAYAETVEEITIA